MPTITNTSSGPVNVPAFGLSLAAGETLPDVDDETAAALTGSPGIEIGVTQPPPAPAVEVSSTQPAAPAAVTQEGTSP